MRVRAKGQVSPTETGDHSHFVPPSLCLIHSHPLKFTFNRPNVCVGGVGGCLCPVSRILPWPSVSCLEPTALSQRQQINQILVSSRLLSSPSSPSPLLFPLLSPSPSLPSSSPIPLPSLLPVPCLCSPQVNKNAQQTHINFMTPPSHPGSPELSAMDQELPLSVSTTSDC